MAEVIDQQAILAAAEDVMVRPVGGDALALISLRVAAGFLELVFRWNDYPQPLGYRVELPDTTDHPVWTRWAPQAVEEWVEYAVRFTLIEDMQTGLLQYGGRHFDGEVLWLEREPA
ncbi:hypothetical protein D477_011606 [Arthrobacter crystallopoietes BAB-32]|uniref:Uncharacterized protein n=1 Tax=Arthrobacter crystallopoietes BAB-32 TaxID=1246476 RepID=N1V1U8_9MICC|nr:hypothetical protein [Arthrobacter crystallopoietes]EMY34062.1 hypothetical protein D477_011606 [Arthrobacter crystallopoietes BAB-32]